MLLWSLFGCALKYQQIGLLKVDTEQIVLSTLEGRNYNLHLGPDEKYVRHLDGCQLRVEGVRFHRHYWVQNWKVTDAGDGSAPFLGILERRGVQYYIKDFNSGSMVLLEKVGKLSEHIGKPVLVVGVVIGAHQVKVMSWRLLE